MSWSYWTQWWTVSYETLSSWLKVFHKVSSNYILTPSITMNTEMTVVWWLYWIDWDLFFRADSTSTPRSFYQIWCDWTNQWWWYRWNNWTAYWTSSWIWKNGWYHCVLVCWSGGVKVYVNWTLVYSNATTSFSWRSQKRWVWYDQWKSSSVNAQWYYSHLIIEKKQWTLNDVLKDYNHTKNLYWIS